MLVNEALAAQFVLLQDLVGLYLAYMRQHSTA